MSTGLPQPGRPALGHPRIRRIAGGRSDGPRSPGLAARYSTQRPSATPEDASRPARGAPAGGRQPGLPHYTAGQTQAARIQASADGGEHVSSEPAARLDAEPGWRDRPASAHAARPGAWRVADAAPPAYDGQIRAAGAHEADAGRLGPDIDSHVHAAGPAVASGYRYPGHLTGPPADGCPPTPQADGPEIGG